MKRVPFAVVLQALYVQRRLVTLLVYGLVTLLAYAGAFALRFDFHLPPVATGVLLGTAPLLLVVRAATNWAFGLAGSRWRFAGPRDVLRLAAATTTGTLLFFAATWLTPVADVPRSVLVMELVLTLTGTCGVWIFYRTGLEELRHLRAGNGSSPRRTLIVGAGEAGHLLAREMQRHPTGQRPIGFVDDDPGKAGARVDGLPVLGCVEDVVELCRRYRIDEIAIAIPSASPGELRRIVQCCESAAVAFKVLPGIAEVLTGEVRLNQLREVRIEDLLGREPVSLELPELFEDLRGEAVLITGGAGSIGSELARQVALHSPRVLVLYDQAETELFYLQAELRERHPELALECVVGDVVDAVELERVFRAHAPSRVFHAAAYKHVPMMQVNVRQAIRNNVVGTMLLAEAAGRWYAEKFVLVSTDKAVRPQSVMGATKRLAEIAVLEAQRAHPETAFAAVRFGNVLGSNGSVIPIFREQIARGVPLTITDAAATRYFMTIPEAVQLILQASLLPEMRGRIAMLEMGEPVRITDLARNLLRLSGLPYLEGRNVVFTGLRPGEKLHEELCAGDEESHATAIPKVRLLTPSRRTALNLGTCLADWERAFQAGEDAAVGESLLALFTELERPTPLFAEPPRTRPQSAASVRGKR